MYDKIKNKSAYLFDMDGTLVDKEPIGPLVFETHFAEYGKRLSSDEKELFLKVWRRDGTDMKEGVYIEQLRQKYAINEEPTTFLYQFFDKYKRAIVSASPLPGVDRFLRQVHAEGIKLAIVTSSKRGQAVAILNFHGWTELFDLIVSEEDITKFKPDPEPFLVAVQKLGLSSQDCVVFEDAKNGVVAAKAASIYVIGLRAGNDVEQDLSAANLIVQSFEDISS